MDKNGKLQRYDRKDYSELVEFPVEIVGRDGVVRRYSFEDSIRLYQRRITFAPIRYRDVDLIRAEVNHCRSRIDQLRRSFFHRFGWGTPEGQPSAEDTFGDLAGELAAFIRRVLRSPGRPEIRFDHVQDEVDSVSTWYVTPETSSSGMLLYVHVFRGADADRVRERFFATLKDLERAARMEGDCERLLAFHHTVDCGFVLTGRGADFSTLVHRDDELEPQIDLAPTPWDEVLEIIRRGDYESALRRCRDVVSSQPWHRNGYVAGAMLAAYLGEHHVAEDLALVGSRYFEGDGVLKYYVGLSRMRQDRVPEALESLREAVALAPELVAARTLLVVMQIQRRRFPEALRLLAERRSVRPDDRRADGELDRLEQWVRWRRAVLMGSGGLLLGGLAGTAAFGMPGLVPAILGSALLVGSWFAFQRQVDTVLTRQRFEEISQGLRRLHRSSGGAPPVS